MAGKKSKFRKLTIPPYYYGRESTSLNPRVQSLSTGIHKSSACSLWHGLDIIWTNLFSLCVGVSINALIFLGIDHCDISGKAAPIWRYSPCTIAPAWPSKFSISCNPEKKFSFFRTRLESLWNLWNQHRQPVRLSDKVLMLPSIRFSDFLHQASLL